MGKSQSTLKHIKYDSNRWKHDMIQYAIRIHLSISFSLSHLMHTLHEKRIFNYNKYVEIK